MKMKDYEERPQSLGEEIANSVSHGMALLAAAAAAPILVVASARHGTAVNLAATSVFAATMVLLYAASVLYHAIPHAAAKRVFRKLDHGAIFLFIAGSYTPFALGALTGPWGWTLLVLVWALAVIGVTLKALDRMRHPVLSTGFYLAMGWLAVVAVNPLLHVIPMTGIVLLAAGGLAYTIGVAFFVLDSKLRYAHFVWHLFVVAGTACHYFAVLHYAI
jgi:hemolysin III